MGNKLLLFILLLTIISFALRLYRINEPDNYYFDEVYHAVTAKAYADNNPAAYDPFAPPPKAGTAYDWLHPPLAKLLQASSIKIFGDNAFGWRLPSVIFGTLVIPSTFLLGYLLFGTRTAIFSALVIAFENLTLVMSRITMNDIFITFFSTTALVFCKLYSDTRKLKYILATSVLLGLAVASKWTGLWVIATIFFYLFVKDLIGRRLDLKLLFVIIIPPVVYLLSYGQFWLQGHTIEDFINLHKQIWWYQNRHDLKHSYATTPIFCVPEGLNGPKQFCPWILDARGVYFSYKQYDQKAGYIYALGNPVVFWLGIVAVFYMIGEAIEKRRKEQMLVLFAYFAFWVPWIFSPRIMFFYHYLPSIPFMAIILGYLLKQIYSTKFKIFSAVILVLIIIVFLYFFPISTALPIKIEDIDKFMWLRTWR